MEEVSAGIKPIQGVGTAATAFVGLTEKGPAHEPTLVTNWSQYTALFGDFVTGAYLPRAVFGYFLNGGGRAYVVSLGSPQAAPAALAATAPVRELPGPDGGRPALNVGLAAPAASADQGSVVVEVEDATDKSLEDAFRLVVRKDGQVAETFDNVTLKRGASHVLTAVKKSVLITVTEVKGAAVRPATGTRVALTPEAPEPAAPGASAPAYIGDAADRTGLSGLEAVDDITVLAVPDLMSAYEAGALDAEGVKAVQLAMIQHCESMGDRMAILDPLPGLTAQQAAQWRQNFSAFDSSYGALYWPWVNVVDPHTKRPSLMPPSGHVAGVWARSDETRGVHKAPANEVVRGVTGTALNATKGEQGLLNPLGVNCLRSFPGQGVRVWGARTLASDAEWRYVNVRRLFNYVEQSILQGTNWVVFEPNDPYLWDGVRRTVTMFLTRVWRSGALFGRTPEEAFFVHCGEENNPPENRDAGVLTIDIGIAPVKPAEFVVFRLSQYAQGSSVQE
ncbi:phage tail sheath subtilisin-like domain-containing protein [Streptomyces sp. NPDC048409]|uniref:phage tail sheath family protein n=1 Tax=Streptomyces sp. NPDC048409 TaxID=3154723 RepID=UPI0034274DC8